MMKRIADVKSAQLFLFVETTNKKLLTKLDKKRRVAPGVWLSPRVEADLIRLPNKLYEMMRFDYQDSIILRVTIASDISLPMVATVLSNWFTKEFIGSSVYISVDYFLPPDEVRGAHIDFSPETEEESEMLRTFFDEAFNKVRSTTQN